MKRFSDLYIRLNGCDPDKFTEAIDRHLGNDWGRADDLGNIKPLLSSPAYAFKPLMDHSLPTAILFLMKKDSDRLWVSNIIPTSKNQLSIEEYNSILSNFKETIVDPVAKELGAGVELTPATYKLEDFISSQETADNLRKFSFLANKSTGTSHPNDQKRWFDFIESARNNGEDISENDLIEFLQEDGWSEETASELAAKYLYSQELLNHPTKQ